jgi:ribosomal protein S18 acetylase RimI-like enzyme
LSNQQGRGIGKYKLAHITNDIKNKGGKSLQLNVNRYNHPAILFYEKQGFSVLKEEDINIGNGYFMNDFVLTLPIV